MGRGPFRFHLFCHKRGGLDPHIYQVNVGIHPKTVPKRHPPGRCRRPGPFFLGRAAIPAPTPKERRPDTVSTDRLTKSLIFHPAIAGSISAKWAAALRAALKRAAALRAALKWAAALRAALKWAAALRAALKRAAALRATLKWAAALRAALKWAAALCAAL